MNRKMLFLLCVLLCLPLPAYAATYEVGPGKPYVNIGDVPWEAMHPGDQVLIYWRAQPYQEKWVIAVPGTEQQPFTVSGIANGSGQLPIIDGNGATTRSAQLLERGARRHQDRRRQQSSRSHAGLDRDREPRDPRRTTREQLHRPERAHELRGQRRRDLRREGPERHDPRLPPHDCPTASSARPGPAISWSKATGSTTTATWGDLRAQQLHRGAGNSLPVQPLRAAARAPAATTSRTARPAP